VPQGRGFWGLWSAGARGRGKAALLQRAPAPRRHLAPSVARQHLCSAAQPLHWFQLRSCCLCSLQCSTFWKLWFCCHWLWACMGQCRFRHCCFLAGPALGPPVLGRLPAAVSSSPFGSLLTSSGTGAAGAFAASSTAAATQPLFGASSSSSTSSSSLGGPTSVFAAPASAAPAPETSSLAAVQRGVLCLVAVGWARRPWQWSWLWIKQRRCSAQQLQRPWARALLFLAHSSRVLVLAVQRLQLVCQCLEAGTRCCLALHVWHPCVLPPPSALSAATQGSSNVFGSSMPAAVGAFGQSSPFGAAAPASGSSNVSVLLRLQLHHRLAPMPAAPSGARATPAASGALAGGVGSPSLFGQQQQQQQQATPGSGGSSILEPSWQRVQQLDAAFGQGASPEQRLLVLHPRLASRPRQLQDLDRLPLVGYRHTCYWWWLCCLRWQCVSGFCWRQCWWFCCLCWLWRWRGLQCSGRSGWRDVWSWLALQAARHLVQQLVSSSSSSNLACGVAPGAEINTAAACCCL